jgi:hypothetical protein
MIAPSREENKLRSSNFSRKQLQHFGRLSLVNLQLAFLTLYIQPESSCRVDSRIGGARWVESRRHGVIVRLGMLHTLALTGAIPRSARVARLDDFSGPDGHVPAHIL